ncbi:MarR family transcriptional regulator [Streptomyces cinnamoneus]|uniref:MarR family transcriptional regulator n=1 Tax=Streptomyces cinnamoneus TaxID=53446 RepID=A0A2G1XJV4_STRCJ|nr:MarR family transcriptional regulator [Streptomyces cinnamoneus]PHQ51522.1 MarR family transcriptional regulator [Streptomyces cinnamoneus]PPT11705.1 MarR family transcriptional regulator [Streptomyces cinnamoneus]
MPDRDESLEIIQRELTAFARRARAAAARLHPELSLVSYALLAHLEDSDGCRPSALAEQFLLNKSTISRQVTTLEELGLVERRTDPGDQRAHILHLTAGGRAALGQVSDHRRAAFQERLADWTAEDLARFAGYLLRYNDRA